MFKTLQKIGKAFMLPIAILPAAGLLLGIGGAFSSEGALVAFPALNIDWLQHLFLLMKAGGNAIFENLPLLLCLGLVIGFAKRDVGAAALAVFVMYAVVKATQTTLISIFTPDAPPIDTGVLGAFIIGVCVIFLHKKFNNIQLPTVLGFFNGARFIPIISALAGFVVGAVFFIIWPPLQEGLTTVGELIAQAGPVGTFFYGFLMRLCGAVGLHHMIYPLFWYTQLGGTEVVNGQTISGAQAIWFAQMADPNHVGLYTEGTRFFAGRYLTMMFGLPGAALAMYHMVPKEKRKKYVSVFLSVALTSFITGITEPLEFMFLFVNPILYVIHCFFDGCAFFICDILNIQIGNSFSGGIIDFILFGVLQGNDKTNWILIPIIGIAWFFLYYVVFRVYIKVFNVATPGRGDDDMGETELPQGDKKNKSSKEQADEAMCDIIVEALGGIDNIEDIDACITRLRVSVKDISKVDKDTIKSKTKAAGILDVSGGLQIVYGAKAIIYKGIICDKYAISA